MAQLVIDDSVIDKCKVCGVFTGAYIRAGWDFKGFCMRCFYNDTVALLEFMSPNDGFLYED